MKYLSRNVWILSGVSLFTDMASEMLYPVLPVYLKHIGFSMIFIGFLEGFVEGLSGWSKAYFGHHSDASGKRLPFIRWGYTLSAVSRPLLAFFTYSWWIFLVRSMDRIGKGIRTGARDAMLADESTTEFRGRVFGFHRSMDTVGAVLGPLLALLYLAWFPEDYIRLFYFALVPGILAVALSFILKANPSLRPNASSDKPGWFSFIRYWKRSPVAYRKLVVGLLVFAAINSSDVFLLLKIKEAGGNDTLVIGMYVFYNLVYAGFAFPAGMVADRIGLRNMYVLGLLCFTAVYLGMSFFAGGSWVFVLFLVYGLYAAATEGISKAWIANLVDPHDTATAIGFYTGFQSLSAFLASSLTGLIWYQWGSAYAFFFSGITALLVAV
ncbi:MAG TPA: MFS transporter, partial [Saprospiraceae bacterium]|nr:MFS transporter [Saprospiraceae bacterium]